MLVSDAAADPAVAALCRRFGDPRVRYMSNPTRLGPAGNHRAALAAGGDQMAILNHDDRWEPTFLERMAEARAAHPEAGLVFCDHWVIDATGRRMEADTTAATRRCGRNQLPPGRCDDLPALVVAHSIPMAMAAAFRRAEVLPHELPADAGPAYDLWLMFFMARAGAPAVYIPDRLTSWRALPTNLTAQGRVDWLLGAARCWDAMAADSSFGRQRKVIHCQRVNVCTDVTVMAAVRATCRPPGPPPGGPWSREGGRLGGWG